MTTEIRAVTITIDVATFPLVEAEGDAHEWQTRIEMPIIEEEGRGPSTFTAAIKAAQIALGKLHAMYCPTDEEAAATADDAAPISPDES